MDDMDDKRGERGVVDGWVLARPSNSQAAAGGSIIEYVCRPYLHGQLSQLTHPPARPPARASPPNNASLYFLPPQALKIYV